jgi:hypothetical protein
LKASPLPAVTAEVHKRRKRRKKSGDENLKDPKPE